MFVIKCTNKYLAGGKKDFFHPYFSFFFPTWNIIIEQSRNIEINQIEANSRALLHLTFILLFLTTLMLQWFLLYYHFFLGLIYENSRKNLKQVVALFLKQLVSYSVCTDFQFLPLFLSYCLLKNARLLMTLFKRIW